MFSLINWLQSLTQYLINNEIDKQQQNINKLKS